LKNSSYKNWNNKLRKIKSKYKLKNKKIQEFKMNIRKVYQNRWKSWVVSKELKNKSALEMLELKIKANNF
jgi:hypothetical protein